ncbi:hypothetical protein SUNI508_12970 [Seiridium unicorne]|uniref:Uncharacterized protein n=1 Tax=Seiridium unicorne TaxID=138068 RepID=A0ABR2VFA2_9PEZI
MALTVKLRAETGVYGNDDNGDKTYTGGDKDNTGGDKDNTGGEKNENPEGK